MTLSMHGVAIDATVHHLEALSAILDKAATHCAARKIDPTVITQFRLTPDMLPFRAQIYIATDLAKGVAARLAGVDVPSYADTETTFEELKARIAKTVAFLKSFKPEQIDGSEAREVVLKIGGNEMKFTGAQYLLRFFQPNFYFHITMAYAILRHCGIEIGKKDYLGM